MNHRVMIFAAGRGHRMKPLTDHTPKPLLLLAGKPIIVWQIEALARAGFIELVINTAWQGRQLQDALGDGTRWGVSIAYSIEGEGEFDALETRGGIVNALAMLGNDPFVTVSGDSVTDFDYAILAAPLAAIARGEIDGHFVLTNNPDFHPVGDFAIRNGRANRVGTRFNYANISCWQPKLFNGLPPNEKARLFPWADTFVAAGRIGAEYYGGLWENIGTPAHLAELDARLRDKMMPSTETKGSR